jgi:predicted nucleic acid-binding protein
VILVDTGPLVALLAERDQHRAACATAMEGLREPLGTVWPVIAEAMFLVGRWAEGPENLWELLGARKIQTLPLDDDDHPRMQELMRKYRDLPMDLADAALVRVAERDGIDTVFTIDRRDFQVYRLNGRRRLKIIP